MGTSWLEDGCMNCGAGAEICLVEVLRWRTPAQIANDLDSAVCGYIRRLED